MFTSVSSAILSSYFNPEHFLLISNQKLPFIHKFNGCSAAAFICTKLFYNNILQRLAFYLNCHGITGC